MTPMLETAIKFYNANKNSDMMVYMVFKVLSEEKVFLPTSKEGYLVSLSVGEDEMIPIFTAQNRVNSDEPILLKGGYLKDYIDALLKAGKHLIINPFSEENIKFFIPYEAIERLLVSVLSKQEKSF